MGKVKRRIELAPVHPGEVIQHELNELKLTQTEFANLIGVTQRTINELCKEKRSLSVDMAIRLSLSIGGLPDMWLSLQNGYDLAQVDKVRFSEIKKIAA